MRNKKVIVGIELVVVIVGIFAFAYGISMTDEIFDKLREPIIPLVSAEDYGAGCCALAETGERCATSTADNCVDGATFAQGALCSETSFCQKGCCYDEDSGIFDKNVIESDCSMDWVKDPNCNLPGAQKGCCILGTNAVYETLGQCETDTLVRALGDDSVVDWRSDLNEMQCFAMSATQAEGACEIGGGECKFVSESECLNYGGDFSEGYLCTSPLLNTSCEMTEETTCVDGKDGVYFVDSCGNHANIYDASRVNDPDYWDKVAEPGEICGDGNEDGNANSKDCGNCNRFLGGACALGLDNNFNPDVGDYYCKDTSCMFDGESYENGESWCVYDGKVGDGDDVVGSRHWKYVCSQGVINVEPCADYRNQICIQSNEIGVSNNVTGNSNVDFRNAVCVANNWRECIGQNENCEDILNCRTERVDIADHFSFDVCTPKYPGGFSFKDERYQETAEQICGLASQTCTVVYKKTFSGKCKVVANEDCLSGKFAEGMNDYCRKLGDCGGEVNIVGEFSESYSVINSPMLGDISKLIALANPIDGQFAPVEDYSEYLEAAGIFRNISSINNFDGENESEEGFAGTVLKAAGGVAGFGLAVAGIHAVSLMSSYGFSFGSAFSMALGGTGSLSIGTTTISGLPTPIPSVAAFSGLALGASIGAIAGVLLAQSVGASPLGTILMASGGALIGGALAYKFLISATFNPLGAIVVGIILIALGFLFGGSKCKEVKVSFECKPWQQPVGGDDCEKCNDDPLKPCSEYRCHSLGAACELVNKGTDNEICIEGNPDDASPPILNPSLDIISDSEKYSDVSDSGFSITSLEGGCVDAYTPLTFGVNTDEPSHCKFDIDAKNFDDMQFDLGTNAYVYNHTTTFPLPDPSHGQSQGSDWTGELNLFIKCRDSHGNVNPDFYNIEMCVNEGPDKTGPIVVSTNPGNDALINYDKNSLNFTLITNELADCRWDINDIEYENMANGMLCNDSLDYPSSTLGYSCSGVLPTENTENEYYISCLDQPWLNDSSDRNSRDFVYRLKKPDNKIAIDWIEPSDDFEISTEGTTIELKIQTSGGGDAHFCAYSFSGFENMIDLFETGNNRIHRQPLNRPAGKNKIYVECRDETGSTDQKTTVFEIVHDTSTPQIARIWKNGGNLKFVTTENAECKYSTKTCRFNWDDGELAGNGKDHSVNAVRGKTYYIKCEDEFGNVPSGCSIAVRAL